MKAARPAKYKMRNYPRCNRCGRPRAVFRKFGLCRICLRELAHQGAIPGMTKSQLVGETTMLTDPIADMLTRIRNANKAMHEHAVMPTSRLKEDIARLLKEEGYIKRLPTSRSGRAAFDDLLVIELKYGRNRERVITDLKRVSKPGRRVYARKDRLPRVLGGMGTAILSTSQGLMTSRTAAGAGVGGEVICFVWYEREMSRIGKTAQSSARPSVNVAIDPAASW